MKTVIIGGVIVNEGKKYKGYIAYENGVITDIGSGDADVTLCAGAEVVDASGCYVLPGVIDSHVHFRDGGDASSPKGNLSTESAAAVAGGVTTYFDMPNTVPPTVSVAALDVKMEHARKTSFANYAFYIGATNDNFDQLRAADYTSVPAIKLFMGASTGNMLVDRQDALDRIFGIGNDILIAVHAESQDVINRNKEVLISQYGTDDLPVALHPDLRSRRACVECAERAVSYAKKHGARLHLLHISTAEELSLLTTGEPSLKRITAETCPHYLYFDKSDYETLGARIKCNPAIKDDTDREALLEAVIDGRIDTIATDHAPHLPADKEGNLFQAASGMPGVQFSLPLMLELTLRNPRLTVERVVELMAHNPAKIYHVVNRGFLRPGYAADIAIVSRTDGYVIEDDDVRSLCGWTPYAGIMLHHKVVRTIVNGGNGPSAVKFIR